MNVTLPKRIHSQETLQLDGRHQITVVGVNGSGKSRFMRRMMADAGENAFFISSLQALFPVKNQPECSSKNITKCYNESISKVQFVKPSADTEFEMLLYLLLNDEMIEMVAYKISNFNNPNNTDNPLPLTKLDRVVKMWNEVFPNYDITRTAGKLRFANALDTKTFTPLNLSNGEKAVFFCIGAALYAPKNSVIFVDSPTMFLHRSITQMLWSLIENSRRDCTFVYLTHDIEFPTSRSDNQTIWVRGGDLDGNEWDYEIIKPHETLSEQLIIDLLGTRKPVLFVEGDNTHSLDFRLYQHLFPEYAVKPMGSCDKVIETVRSFNDIQSFHHLDSKGIVDRDRRTDKEVEYLHNKKIFVPDVAEIENLFMLEPVVRTIARLKGKNDIQVFMKVKANLMKMFKQELKSQALLHTRHFVKRSVEVVIDRRFKNISALEEHLDNLSEELNPRAIYEEHCRTFNRYYQEGDYRGVLKVYNQKLMLVDTMVAPLCGFKSKDEYIKAVFSTLKRENHDAEIIRTALKQCFGDLE